MALSDQIRKLRDVTLVELSAEHDYYVNSKFAWKSVDRLIANGETINIRNVVTGNDTTHLDLATKTRSYVAVQVTRASFQQFISTFEYFFFDLLRLWLMAYPQSLVNRQIDFKSVLEAPDKEAIALMVVNKELNEVLYDRPASWFVYLNGKVKIGCPTADEIDRIAEAKASRDVLVHNRGVVSKTYLAKAGKLARFADGETLEIPETYHRLTWELICKIVADISDAAISKVA